MSTPFVFGTNRCAPPPFDGKKPGAADIIISTSNRTDFYLLKGILIVASPFFEDMFSLVQPTENMSAELDRIDVSEDSTTFETLMRFCYPVSQPKISDLDLLEKVMEAAMKYQMEVATDLLKAFLRSFVSKNPLRCFATACRLQLEKEATMAAKVWKSQAKSLKDTSDIFSSTFAGGSYIPEFATISANAYLQLLRYLRGEELDKVKFTIPPPSRSPPISSLETSQASRWTVNSDCILLSTDNETFPVHSIVLRAAYAEALLGTATDEERSSGEKQEIAVDLHSSTLRAILNFCYPMPYFTPLDIRELVRVLEGARKCGMQKMADAARKQVMKHAETEPLAVYLLAGVNGWVDEAQEAARHTVVRGLGDVYVPEMEEAPASVYHALLDFQHSSQNTVKNVVVKHVGTNTQSHWQWYSAKRNKALPVALSLPFVEKTLQESYGGQQYCRSCSSYYTSSLGCMRCDPEKSKLSTLLEQSAAMEEEIKDALSKVRRSYTQPM